MIVGGWAYVVAAYAVAWGGLLTYGVSLYVRRRAARRDALEAEKL